MASFDSGLPVFAKSSTWGSDMKREWTDEEWKEYWREHRQHLIITLARQWYGTQYITMEI